MIYVNRSRLPPPASLTGRTSAGALERAAVVAFYRVAANRGSPFKGYAAYASKEVKARLLELFHSKCAYCEIGYGGSPLDVEHFRPKSAIVHLDEETFEPIRRAKPVKPGYYWLASDWTNLLPSCIDCNRRREHAFKGSGPVTAGKGNSFPLNVGTKRATHHRQDVARVESPLLIDPCVDDPAAHLSFGPSGTILFKTERGRATIEVFALQRMSLVEERDGTRLKLMNSIMSVRSAATRLARNPADVEARGDFLREMEHIRNQFLQDKSPFLAMSRQIVLEKLGAQSTK